MCSSKRLRVRYIYTYFASITFSPLTRSYKLWNFFYFLFFLASLSVLSCLVHSRFILSFLFSLPVFITRASETTTKMKSRLSFSVTVLENRPATPSHHPTTHHPLARLPPFVHRPPSSSSCSSTQPPLLFHTDIRTGTASELFALSRFRKNMQRLIRELIYPPSIAA